LKTIKKMSRAGRHGAGIITKSAPGEKLALYHYIDEQREAFSLRVDGDFPGTREFWYAHRELDLRGPTQLP
jgi:hypothetical protein